DRGDHRVERAAARLRLVRPVHAGARPRAPAARLRVRGDPAGRPLPAHAPPRDGRAAETEVSERADLLVLGAGPTGLTAAITARRAAPPERPAPRVLLLEKAARPGVKILISGGNRCNLTHD